MSNKMFDALNVQITNELYSAYLYLGMSAYFESEGLKGFSSWMLEQSREEVIHAMKIYNYILSRGYKINLNAIETPSQDWNSTLRVFEASLEHEKKVTATINDLVKISIDTNDYATHTFLQWFVTEQVEEEASFNEVIDKLKLAKDSSALLFLDAEMGARKNNTKGNQ